jgi:predicted nucleic acid-binding protein
VTKFTLDTNLYIRAYRSEADRERLNDFLQENTPRIHLHAVVLQELMLGARSQAHAREVHRAVGIPFEQVGRVVTPSRRAWRRAAELVAAMVERRSISRGGYTASFLNDVLIAASCREAEVTLITANTADFERIREVEPFGFAAPWPSGSGAP